MKRLKMNMEQYTYGQIQEISEELNVPVEIEQISGKSVPFITVMEVYDKKELNTPKILEQKEDFGYFLDEMQDFLNEMWDDYEHL